MAAFLFWFDSAPQKLASIVAIALCAVCMLPHVRAEHVLQASAPPQTSVPAQDQPSLFLTSGGLVPDSGALIATAH